MNRSRLTKAFTLIELLVVISIIGLLASIVLVSLSGARSRSKTGAAQAFSGQLDRAVGDKPIAQWDFNECSGATSRDWSNNGYTATPSNSATMWSTSVVFNPGCSMLFDGVDDFVDTSYPALDKNDWTITAWVYDTKANNGYRAIVQMNQNSDDAIYIYPGNYLAYWPCNINWTGQSFPSNEWVHVALSYSSTNGFVAYMNGIKSGTIGTCADATDWDFLRIGGFGTGDPERWKGNIDSVHVYAQALSAMEIGRIYAMEHTNYEHLAGK